VQWVHTFPVITQKLNFESSNHQILLQTNPVNRIANLTSFFMRLTGICDYPYQTNIRKFTALLNFCPHACYLTPLLCYSLTPNAEISRTVGYKSVSRCSKNPLLLIQYFKLWNPSVFSKPTVISWNINLKLLRALTLHVVLNKCTVWCKNHLYQLWNVSWTRGLFSVCFGLCSAVVNMFMSRSRHARRLVELWDIEMLLEVLKFLGPDTAGCCM